MNKRTSTALEQRIANALEKRVASADLHQLIAETEQAVAEAELTAQTEREKALDPIASPDADKAEQAAWTAELRRDRQRSSLSHLRQRLYEVERAEATARWETDHDAAKAKRDAAAKEFAEVYPTLSAQLCDLFRRVNAVDQECSSINSEAPEGEHCRLLGVELTARNLQSFGVGYPAIIDRAKLPDWKESDRLAWPPPKIPLSVVVATSMTPSHDPRFSANWAAAREQDMARRAAAEARWAEEEEARQEASRRAYEASLRR